ncbi:MAG: thioredoxin-like domain-containing protein [Pseudomonadota bacterium]
MASESAAGLRTARRCEKHLLATGPDGLCALCRRETLPPPRRYSTWAWGGVAGTTLLVSLGAVGFRAFTTRSVAANADRLAQAQGRAPSHSASPLAAEPPPLAAGNPPPWLRQEPRPVRDSGIGAPLKLQDGRILIASTAAGFGAASAKLSEGDEILAVDGRPTKGREVAQIASWIRGQSGTSVAITVLGKDSTIPRSVVIVRKRLNDLTSPGASATTPKPDPNAAKARRKSALLNLVGHPAPTVFVDKWVNHEPVPGKLAGRTLLVEFWATWCGPCRRSLPHLAELAREYEDRGLTVVGISTDDELSELEQFLAKNPLPFAVGWGSLDDHDEFVLSEIPTLLMVGPDGIVRWVDTDSMSFAEFEARIPTLMKSTPPSSDIATP